MDILRYAMTLAVAFICSTQVACVSNKVDGRPNIILIMTDDQGYGDVAAHGNQVIRTRHMDALHSQSVRLTDFHVDPTCSPTRAALLTGRYSMRTGVWHTIQGRSMLNPSEVTLAEALRNAGYATGLFGKWHLGDSFPCRPQDQGFDEVLTFGDGAITGINDYFDNDYFDDHYLHNGKWKPYQGYCTDVWFDEATKWIDKQEGEPFFCYIPTNAPHWPYWVDEKYSKPYEAMGLEKNHAAFWGMITNIDDNIGRLMAHLDESGLTENTIVVFMTDNGSSASYMDNRPWKSYTFNAGMRGYKGSAYDGGHRVPFYIRWPAGGVGGADRARDINALTAHIDIMPTLLGLCGVKPTGHRPFDGIDLSAALRGERDAPRDRTLFVHSQRVEIPQKGREPAVMTQQYRLVHGDELYDMVADPGQRKNIAGQKPQVVDRLREGYDRWWDDLSASTVDVAYIIGDDRANPTLITTHDLHSDNPLHDGAPWHRNNIKRGTLAKGFFIVNVAKSGRYRFTLRRWPVEHPGVTGAIRASVRVGDVLESAECDPAAEFAVVELDLQAAKQQRLEAMFHLPDGKGGAALFVDVERLGN